METLSHGGGGTGSGTEGGAYFRCPACRRLYAADLRDLMVDEPIFECESCGAEFVAKPSPERSAGPSPSDPAFAEANRAMHEWERNRREAYEAESIEQMVEEALSQHSSRQLPNEQSLPSAPAVPPLARVGDDAEISPRSRARIREMQEELAAKPGAKLPLAQGMSGWSPCPKCLKRNPPKAAECRSCGIVFAKMRPGSIAESDLELGGTRELSDLWDGILADWENDRLHMEFLAKSADETRLPYASKKYGLVLSANPGDEIALEMRGRIIKMASAGFEPRSERPWAELRTPRLTSMAIALSSAVLFAGLLLPSLRNLAGVGASMLAVSVGLRIYLRGGLK